MFTRWVQFGVFSPSLRTHSHKTSPARMISTLPNPYFSIMRHFYRLRARLVPYISNAQREAYDTGVQVVRPMYYAHARVPNAYSETAQHEFYFGPDVWTAPIAAPAPNASVAIGGGTNLTAHTFWLPPGRWIEWYSYEALEAPATGMFVSRNYSLSEAPVFSRSGAIIPQRTLPAGTDGVLGTAMQVPTDLTIVVYPGIAPAPGASITTTSRIYDDDGSSLDYEDGAYFITPIDCTWSHAAAAEGADTLSCTVGKPKGAGFSGFPATRRYSFRFPGTWAPASVDLVVGDGVATPLLHDPYGYPDPLGEDARWITGQNMWSYEGSTLSTWVRLDAAVDTAAGFTITLRFPAGARLDDSLLTSGFARRVSRALVCKTEFDSNYGIVYPSDNEHVLNVTATAMRLSAGAAVGNAALSARLLGAVRKQLKRGAVAMADWKVPANHTFQGSLRRCLGAVTDALTPSVQEVPEPAAELFTSARAYADVSQQLDGEYYGMGGDH